MLMLLPSESAVLLPESALLVTRTLCVASTALAPDVANRLDLGKGFNEPRGEKIRSTSSTTMTSNSFRLLRGKRH